MAGRALSLAVMLACAAGVVGIAGPALACGPQSDCMIGERHYRINMPAGHDGTTRIGAILFMHGYRGSAAGAMNNAAFTDAISQMGLALIAAKSSSDDWDIPNAPSERELVELDYFDRLLDDVTARFSIDRDRIMATGFSAGGMMVWNLACERGESFAGFVPIAGTFWAPIPEECPSAPVHLLHVHGSSDKIVPIEGRPIQATDQGNVLEAVDLFAKAGDFGPSKTDRDGELECERRTNPSGKLLELCLHPGGHSFKPRYVTRAWNELEKIGAFQ